MSETRSDRGLFKVGGALYAASALAFFVQLAGEITGYFFFGRSWIVHEIISLVTLTGFLIGGVLLWRSSQKVLQRNTEVETHLRTARGELFSVLEEMFDTWDLSAAERDIALLTVKGMSVAEIAKLRETSQGTVKSQNNSIYRKAGVKSRVQLLGTLIDGLLIDAVPPKDQPDKP